ncbi:hypothetical protein ACFQY3_25235 [Paenibacillus farraposensis]
MGAAPAGAIGCVDLVRIGESCRVLDVRASARGRIDGAPGVQPGY